MRNVDTFPVLVTKVHSEQVHGKRNSKIKHLRNSKIKHLRLSLANFVSLSITFPQYKTVLYMSVYTACCKYGLRGDVAGYAK